MVPEADLRQVRQWAEGKVPDHLCDQVRIEVEVGDRALTILECRPPWHPDMGPEWTRVPVARLRYTKTRTRWSLYWPDRNGRFHEYDLAKPSPQVQDLLAEIDADPTCIFWG